MFIFNEKYYSRLLNKLINNWLNLLLFAENVVYLCWEEV